MRHRKLALFATIVGILSCFPVYGLTTTITRVTPSDLVTNSTNITFEFVSSAPDAYFVCSLDWADPIICTSPWSYYNLPDGPHRFHVMSVSPTEGRDYVGAIHNWRIDTVAPSTKLTATPAGPDSYSVDLQSNEPNSTFVCALDANPPLPCTSPHLLTNVGPGNHYFRVQAIDEAKNIDPIGADFTFTVHQAPMLNTVITSVDPSAPFTNVTQVLFGFMSNQSTATFRCTLAGQVSACASPHLYTRLPDGFYTFTVQAVDVFGNIDPIGASYSWTVDTVPPVGTLVNLESTSTIITVTWTSNEPATTALNWGLDHDVSRTAPGDPRFKTSHTVRITGLSSNSLYSVQPSGIDRAGNISQMPRLTIRTKR